MAGKPQFAGKWPYRPPERTPAPRLDRIFRPPDHVLLAEAVDILGKERFGDAWTGAETQARNRRARNTPDGFDPAAFIWSVADVVTAMPSRPPSWRVLTEIGDVRVDSKEAADARWREAQPRLMEMWKQELAAWKRFDEIVRVLRDRLYVGSLLAFAHRSQVGDLWPIPVRVWGKDGIERVFGLGHAHLQWKDTNEIEFMESGGKISGRVVIAREHLTGTRTTTLERMTAARTPAAIQGNISAQAPQGAEASPPVAPAAMTALPAGKPTIAARTECERWIKEIADANPAPRRRGEVWAEAKQRFGSRLSERAFRLAWQNASPDAWKQPGRKSGRRIDTAK